ncbi:MAG: ATP-dependent DNA helicase [Burkholderiales bacterium]|nr:ATP-dependent DNA helicase [Burkholderiales bacterium]
MTDASGSTGTAAPLPVLDADFASRLAAAFAPDGPLARAIDGFRARPQQVEMAHAVAQAMQARATLVAEAGTGTGKTFAYLVPALLAGGKVIVSTGTRTLQDQLFFRDLPTVRDALGAPLRIALLKGRSNYVCHWHLGRAAQDGRFASRADVAHLKAIERFARTSETGDRGHLAEVPEDAAIWSVVTSTRDNCLGNECPHHGECFVLKARRDALEADVVVVNHHLFFADVVLRDEGAGELLPACNTVILDEAHQLPDTAGTFFGESSSSTQWLELARDTKLEAVASAADFAPLPDAVAAFDKAVRDLRLAWSAPAGRAPAHDALARTGFDDALATVADALATLESLLGFQAERSEGLARLQERAAEQQAKLARWRDGATADMVRWVEVFSHAVQLHATPLSIAPHFRRQVDASARAWVLVSATLSVRGDFAHYLAQMGLESVSTAAWDSPFDYAHQALLYVPEGMPEPNTPDYTRAVVDAAMPLIEAAGGRTFLLFTSLRAMREAHERVIDGLKQRALDCPVLVQGEGSRTELLDRFRRLGNAVLIGSHSFWEGVDVRGPTLSLVVIDRLPFTPPDDPVLTARIAKITEAGGNAFMDWQLPHAVIQLKQGAGRLIRDERDRGVLMLCDPRVITKQYGKRVWRSLPPMRRTRSQDDAVAFLEALER